MDKRIQYALVASVAYVALSSPQAYKFTNQLASMFGCSTSNPAGCPNTVGLITHGLVVAGILYALLSQNYLVAPTGL